MRYFVYIVECSDGSFYTGWTNDFERRVKVHNQGKGAKYTRSRLPVELRAVTEFSSRSQAMKVEAQVKKLPKREKIDYLTTWKIDQDEL